MTNRDYSTGCLRGLLAPNASRLICAILFAKAPLVCLALLPFNARANDCAARARSGVKPSELYVELPIERDGGPILVRVNVELKRLRGTAEKRDTEFTMLLDTGAEISCIDATHRASLGPPASSFFTPTPLGPVRTDMFHAPKLRIGELVLRPRPEIPCLDLQWLSDGIGEQVDGLLGMDALREFVISIDFDAGKLQFRRAARRNFARRVPIKWRGEFGAQRPFVQAAFEDGVAEDFLVDTAGIANSSATLRKELFDRFLERGILRPVVPAGVGDTPAKIVTRTGVESVTLGRATSLSLGGFTAKEPVFAPHPRVSAVCLNFLSRYFVTFDFPNSVMYLRPGKGFARADIWYNLTSFIVSKRDARVVVEAVRENGWGAKGGIQQGDSILAINGQETKSMSLFTIRRMLATETRQVIDLRRSGAEMRIVLDMTSAISQLVGENVRGTPGTERSQLKTQEEPRDAPRAAGMTSARRAR